MFCVACSPMISSSPCAWAHFLSSFLLSTPAPSYFAYRLCQSDQNTMMPNGNLHHYVFPIYTYVLRGTYYQESNTHTYTIREVPGVPANECIIHRPSVVGYAYTCTYHTIRTSRELQPLRLIFSRKNEQSRFVFSGDISLEIYRTSSSTRKIL